MKIVRTMPEEGWVPIANTAARDHRLSWRARGLLAELLSYPDGWETNVDKLVEIAELAGGKSEGRDAMRGAMNELLAIGYARKWRCREAGRWVTKVAVSDAIQGPDLPAPVVPAPAQPAPESQALLERRTTNTDLGTRTDQYSASLISFAAAAADASAASRRDALLEHAYVTINKLNGDQRRAALLLVERRRKRIYRDARNDALKQYGTEDPKILQGAEAVAAMDTLSLKYVAHHYITESGELPIWFARPVGWSG